MRVLFICNQRLNRSPTAEELFRDRCETRSAGLFNEEPVTRNDIAWADTVVVMEDHQRPELVKRFPKDCLQKRILSFNIPDIYRYRQRELIALLESRFDEAVRPLL
jgi:predicted protein tyrosine phosphatase